VNSLWRALVHAARPLVGLVALWLAGLVWFVADLGERGSAPTQPADALVVLTGGSRRLEAGLALLGAGQGRKLFVSGVPAGISVEDVLRPVGASADAGLIVLGHDAGNTIGNAAETARWLKAEGYRSLYLVTADYHMRRALLEFHRVLPADAIVIPDPIAPDRARPGLWRAASRVVMVEYTKYLGALARRALVPGPAA